MGLSRFVAFVLRKITHHFSHVTKNYVLPYPCPLP